MVNNHKHALKKLRWLTIVVLFFLASCEKENHEPLRAWQLSSAHANMTSCCSFSDDRENSPCNNYNPIFSAILGLESEATDITLAINENTFLISQNGHRAISGLVQQTKAGLKFISEDHVLIVRSAEFAGDSLLLKLDGDGNFGKTELVFKRR